MSIVPDLDPLYFIYCKNTIVNRQIYGGQPKISMADLHRATRENF